MKDHLDNQRDLYARRYESRSVSARMGLQRQNLSDNIMRLLGSFASCFGSTNRPIAIVDIGGGDGAYLNVLVNMFEQDGGVAVGQSVVLDLSRVALNNASKRGLGALEGAATALPLGTGSIDIVCLIHVLEHLNHDDLAAREASRILRPGGMALVIGPNRLRNVYAPFIPGTLYERYVVKDHVRSGYDASQLDCLFHRHGLEVVSSGYYGFLGTALELFVAEPTKAVAKLLRLNAETSARIMHKSETLRAKLRALDGRANSVNRHGSGTYCFFRKPSPSTTKACLQPASKAGPT